MPSVTPNDNDLIGRLAAMERRLSALEARRRSNRIWINASGGTTQTFNNGSYTPVNWDTVGANTNMPGIWSGTGPEIVLPFSGTYMFLVTMPLVNSGSITFDVGLQLTPSGGSPVQMRTTSLITYTGGTKQLWVPVMGDMQTGDSLAIALTALGGARTLASSLDFQIVQVG